MSDVGAFDDEAIAAYEDLAGEFGESASGDLTSLLGCEVGFGTPVVEVVDRDEATCHPAPIVHFAGRAGDDPVQAVHLILGAADAVTIAGLQVGKEPSEIEQERKSEVDDTHLAALAGAMKLVTAVLGRLALDKVGLGDFENEAPVSLPEPEAGGRWLGPGPFVRLCFDLSIEGFERGCLMVLVAAPAGDADGAEGSEAIGEGPLLLLDGDGVTRDAITQLAEELGREIQLIDPAEMPGLDDEAFDHAVAFVLAWNLCGRSGIELVEALRRRPSTRGKPIFLASEIPTRGMVRAALRAGATSFLMRPYDADEMRARGLG